MNQRQVQHFSKVVVADASVLINFLRVERTDLIARHSLDFTVTDHVADEVTNDYPSQQEVLMSAIDAGFISQVSIRSPEELALFGLLSASGRLGAGECSAIAMAVHRRHILAIDDLQATKHARRADQTLRVLTTQDLMVSMIDEGLLDVVEADGIKIEWALRHRFHLKLNSFKELYP